MGLLTSFARVCVLFVLLGMYIQSWTFFLFKLGIEQKIAEWYYFATMWNFYLHAVYAVIAFFTGVIDLVAQKELIVTKRSLQKLMTNLISPLTMFVVITFWVLFLTKPDLLRHKKQQIPVWFNMNVHLYIIFLPVAEFAFLPRSHSPIRKSFNYCFLVGIAYCSFVEYSIVNYNIAPYPMFLGITYVQRAILYVLFMIIGIPISCYSSYGLKNLIYKLQGSEHVNKSQ
ncbi:uncharacterized protein LOC142343939 [Convolutriloba macropyga]|uniref:uncharacterized protein LOC142343939 n=1 Tax=Convolutriloba macropyga TaxID=536237 RepID=UPI003F5280C1